MSTHQLIQPRPDGRRAAASWVAGTGAFLLLAAAAVFVAVRWDQLSPGAKLAVVCGLTASCLAGGRALRSALPATGDAVFHLGALLVPLDVAAVGAHAGLGWREVLLVDGLVSTPVLAGLASVARSGVLARATLAAGAAAAAGVAAVGPVPLAVALVALAVGAEAAGRSRAAVAWALAGGLAPLLPGVLPLLAGPGIGAGVVGELSGTGGWSTLAGAAASLLAAGLVGRHARRAGDTTLAYAAFACVAVASGSAWSGADLGGKAATVGLAGAFMAVQSAALAWRRDGFWSLPLAVAARAAEAAAGAATVLLAALLFVAPATFSLVDPRPQPVLGFAATLLAAGWVGAWLRGQLAGRAGHVWALGAAAVAAAAAVHLGAASAPATAAALVGAAAVVVAVAVGAEAANPPGVAARAGSAGSGGGTGGAVVWATVMAAWAPAVVIEHPFAGPVAGLAAAAVIAAGAIRDRQAPGTTATLAGQVSLGAVAGGAALLGLVSAAGALGAMAVAIAGAGACWAIAVALDAGGGGRAGDGARLAMLVPPLAMVGGPPAELLVVAVAVLAAFAVDAVQCRRPELADGAAVAAQFAVFALAGTAGLDAPATGLTLCVGALAWAGLATVADAPWRRPFVVAAAAGAAGGLVLAAGDGSTLSNALLVVGGLLVAAGVAGGRAEIAHAGGLAATSGLAGHLAIAGVTAGEAYALPVAAHLLFAGALERRRRGAGCSSWLAYAPAVGVLGGVALAERVAGGGGWHAVVAGAVGVAALCAGAFGRLAGPLVTGTALVVAVTVHEMRPALAGVPTWGWLAAAGATLLLAGVALERRGTSPAEAGRRLADVLAERMS